MINRLLAESETAAVRFFADLLAVLTAVARTGAATTEAPSVDATRVRFFLTAEGNFVLVATSWICEIEPNQKSGQ